MPVPYRYVVYTLLLTSLHIGSTVADDSRPASGPEHQEEGFSPGWRAYLDPATGKLIDHPPFGKAAIPMSQKALERFSTSHFGLIEQVLPNGMRIVDLRGRFRQGSLATVNPKGKVQIHRFGGEIFANAIGRPIQESLHLEYSANEQEDKNDE